MRLFYKALSITIKKVCYFVKIIPKKFGKFRKPVYICIIKEHQNKTNTMSKTSKTVNRGWLKKQIEKGNVEIKCDMILTDDYALDAATNCQKSGWAKADIKNFSDYDFQYKSGKAYWKEDGTILWRMISNEYYTVRIIN